jgi:hypothetical protein
VNEGAWLAQTARTLIGLMGTMYMPALMPILNLQAHPADPFVVVSYPWAQCRIENTT